MNELQAYGDSIGTVHSLKIIEGIDDTYSYHARDFVAFCKAGARDVNADTVKAYFEHLKDSTYKAGTQRIKRQAIKKRIRQLMENAPIDDQVRLDQVLKNLDKFGKSKAPSVASSAVRQNKVINEGERLLLLATATKRLGLIMEFLWMTGCRIGEVVGVRIGDCIIEGGQVDVRVMGKGSKERHVFIKISLYEKVRTFFDGSTYLFETQGGKPYRRNYVSDQIHALGLKVLKRSISAHSYRHSFATRKIRNTGNLKGVSKYLGHSSTSITSDMYDHNLLGTGDLLEDERIE